MKEVTRKSTQSNTRLQESIIRTLLYFDLFQYPLTSDEVYRFLGTNSTSAVEVSATLDELAAQGLTHKFYRYYGFEKSRQAVVRRMRGNRMAQRMHAFALRRGRLIGMFPFVRGVMASGSFSKGYMDSKSDLDFFVITKSERLWIARTLIALYKRIFFLNSHKYFCCNYFVDEKHLLINEKNLFTATELATLIPLYGEEYYHQLISGNPWLSGFFPNFRPLPVGGVPVSKPGILKWLLEASLPSKFAAFVDSVCMKITLRRWEKLYGTKYSREDFDLAFKTRRYVSKNHPRHFQRNVLHRYEEKINQFYGTNEFYFNRSD